jgi:hypothetical protein
VVASSTLWECMMDYYLGTVYPYHITTYHHQVGSGVGIGSILGP